MELLSPAGNMERLETAFYFGADAVYLSGRAFGLRAYAGNFDDQQLEQAVARAHELGKKAYIAANIFMREADISPFKDYIALLGRIKADGIIISDLGAVGLAKEICPELPLHISTQFSAMNHLTVTALHKMGASRIILARELSMDEIKRIKDSIPDDVELEAFVHGAMCMAYSGRCLLSSFLTGRQANRGECTQPCRWEYSLVEKQRPGEYMPIMEDEHGTYILNSRDLCMIEHLAELNKAGVDSIKIEGRMKTSYYTAVVTNAYCRALNLLKQGREFDPALKEELLKASNRDFTTGFYYGNPLNDGQRPQSGKCVQDYEFSALCLGWDGANAILEQRNKINKGDTLEILSPNDYSASSIRVSQITDLDGNEIECANRVQQIIKIPCSLPLSKNDILRKCIKSVR